MPYLRYPNYWLIYMNDLTGDILQARGPYLTREEAISERQVSGELLFLNEELVTDTDWLWDWECRVGGLLEPKSYAWKKIQELLDKSCGSDGEVLK